MTDNPINYWYQKYLEEKAKKEELLKTLDVIPVNLEAWHNHFNKD